MLNLMPKVECIAKPTSLRMLVPTLAVNKATGKAFTLLRLENEVLIVGGNTLQYLGDSGGFFDNEWISRNYELVREYNVGTDTLAITL